MVKLLKLFGKGILNTLLLPIYLIIWSLYAVYCFVCFIAMFFINVVEFFRGKNNDGELIEDLEARKILLEKEKADEQAKEIANIMYQNALAQAAINQQMSMNQTPITPVQPFGMNNFAPQAPAQTNQQSQVSQSETNIEQTENGDKNDVSNDGK